MFAVQVITRGTISSKRGQVEPLSSLSIQTQDPASDRPKRPLRAIAVPDSVARAALRDRSLLSAAQRAPFHRLRHSSAERMRAKH